MAPEVIFCFFAYFKSLRHNLPASRITRILPLSEISARPRWAASTLRYLTSLTRTPVAQMASISRASRSFPLPLAASTSRSYSGRFSSRDWSRNMRCWIFRYLMRQSRPRKRHNPLRAASMELMVTGIYPAESRCAFHSAASSFVRRRSSSQRERARRSRRYFSIVPGACSSVRKCRR